MASVVAAAAALRTVVTLLQADLPQWGDLSLVFSGQAADRAIMPSGVATRPSFS